MSPDKKKAKQQREHIEDTSKQIPGGFEIWKEEQTEKKELED